VKPPSTDHCDLVAHLFRIDVVTPTPKT